MPPFTMNESLEKLRRAAAWHGYKLVKIGEKGNKAEPPLARWSTAIAGQLPMPDLPIEECPIFDVAGCRSDVRILHILLRADLKTRGDVLSLSSPAALQERSRLTRWGIKQKGLGATSLLKIDRWRTMLIQCSGDLARIKEPDQPSGFSE